MPASVRSPPIRKRAQKLRQKHVQSGINPRSLETISTPLQVEQSFALACMVCHYLVIRWSFSSKITQDVAGVTVMRKIAIQRRTARDFATSVVGAAVMLVILAPHSRSDELYGKPPPNVAAYIEGLISSYPRWISRRDGNLLTMRSGLQFAVSDGRENKSFDEMLQHPDIDDMFYVPYPAGSVPNQPSRNFDPGRVRFQPLFDAMYGDCKSGGVANNLKSIAAECPGRC